MLRAAIFICLLNLSQPAFALSGISITADKITYDDATLNKANLALDLTGSDIAVVQAETLEYGKARLDKAHITIDLKANTTMLVKGLPHCSLLFTISGQHRSIDTLFECGISRILGVL